MGGVGVVADGVRMREVRSGGKGGGGGGLGSWGGATALRGGVVGKWSRRWGCGGDRGVVGAGWGGGRWFGGGIVGREGGGG